MSGKGQRFIDAGYKDPKPLIEVEGRPIISHVIDLFSKDDEFIFICNREHLESTNMYSILNQYSPAGKIVDIDSHKKGPVYAVSKVYEYIDNDEPAIINYCDFSCYWNYSNFRKWLKQVNCDGCIPSYKGFHPHSLGNTNYAYLKEIDNKVKEIQEKRPYTNNRMNEFASSGTYYFAKGRYIKKYFDEAIQEGLNTKGEYYCSLVYNLMIRDHLNVNVYELEHFMQWGTPSDLEEYIQWSNIFKDNIRITNENCQIGTTIIPMAGKGSRFLQEGYKIPKPLISINNQPMVINSAKSLPLSEEYKFIYNKNIMSNRSFKELISKEFSNSNFIELNNTPQGQAITCLEGVKSIDSQKIINISACDHAITYNNEQFEELISKKDFDIIVWVKRGYKPAERNPQMYGWLVCDGQKVKDVSVKKPLSDPKNDPIVIGTFTFREKNVYLECLNNLLNRDGLINDEYYIDSMIIDAIRLNLKCIIFEVENFICWGTPNELNTYLYWQSCFSKWKSHPYIKSN